MRHGMGNDGRHSQRQRKTVVERSEERSEEEEKVHEVEKETNTCIRIMKTKRRTNM